MNILYRITNFMDKILDFILIDEDKEILYLEDINLRDSVTESLSELCKNYEVDFKRLKLYIQNVNEYKLSDKYKLKKYYKITDLELLMEFLKLEYKDDMKYALFSLSPNIIANILEIIQEFFIKKIESKIFVGELRKYIFFKQDCTSSGCANPNEMNVLYTQYEEYIDSNLKCYIKDNKIKIKKSMRCFTVNEESNLSESRLHEEKIIEFEDDHTEFYIDIIIEIDKNFMQKTKIIKYKI